VGLYRDLLGRNPDAAGRSFWVASLDSGNLRSAVAQAFLEAVERRSRIIDSLYLGILGRLADSFGRDFFLNAWDQGTLPDGIVRKLLASDEFFDRFAASRL
jgi:hypothetical protein